MKPSTLPPRAATYSAHPREPRQDRTASAAESRAAGVPPSSRRSASISSMIATQSSSRPPRISSAASMARPSTITRSAAARKRRPLQHDVSQLPDWNAAPELSTPTIRGREEEQPRQATEIRRRCDEGPSFQYWEQAPAPNRRGTCLTGPGSVSSQRRRQRSSALLRCGSALAGDEVATSSTRTRPLQRPATRATLPRLLHPPSVDTHSSMPGQRPRLTADAWPSASRQAGSPLPRTCGSDLDGWR
jgi:hypothetical protein